MMSQLIQPRETESANDDLAQDGGKCRRQWSNLGIADKGDSAEWPTHHDYPQKREEMLNLRI